MKKILIVLVFILVGFTSFSQDSIIKIKPHFKYEFASALGLSVPITNEFQWSNPVSMFNLEFGIMYQRWKFKVEPKVSYTKETFSYGLTTKIVFVIWKSK
jgi:hypothetical protein